jgi:hypothetical protein
MREERARFVKTKSLNCYDGSLNGPTIVFEQLLRPAVSHLL